MESVTDADAEIGFGSHSIEGEYLLASGERFRLTPEGMALLKSLKIEYVTTMSCREGKEAYVFTLNTTYKISREEDPVETT